MSEKKFGSIITKNGIVLITDCILNGKKLSITTAAAGDGGGAYYLPDAEQTTLRNECWRGEIAGFALNKNVPNMLDIKVIIDDEAGEFTIREMGLFTADGIMIAVCNTPDTEKISNSGISGKITMVMHIVVADTSAVEIKINPELDAVTSEQLANHNSDPNAHANLLEKLRNEFSQISYTAVEITERDPDKTNYGLESGKPGGWETENVTINANTFTGTAEVTIIVDESQYDAENVTAKKSAATNGMIIIEEK